MLRSRLHRVLIPGSVIALAAVVAAAQLTVEHIPKKARAALQKLAGGSEIVKVEAGHEDGIPVYEGVWSVDGREVEAEVTADGTLIELEESVDAEDVPLAVRKAAEKAFADGKVAFTKVTTVVYEAEGRAEGKEKELTITPTGKVAGKESKEKDDEEDEEEEEEK